MNRYKVLWFDDEHETLETFKEEAFENDIEVIGFNNATEGIEELERNFSNYHAIIVDGLFFDIPEQVSVNSSGTAFGKVARFLENQKTKGNIIPWFILSGQPGFVKEKNDIFLLFKDLAYTKGKVYDKNNDDDYIRLFSDIKNEVSNIDKVKIKNKYPEPFQAIGENFLSIENETRLMNGLLDYENNSWSSDSFNPLRKIIEAIYSSLHEYDEKLIPFGCLRFENGKVNFKFCELKLTGRKIIDRNTSKVIYERSIKALPDHLGKIIGPITDICNINSHATNEKYLTRYSYGSVLFSIVDLMIWYKNFIEDNYL